MSLEAHGTGTALGDPIELGAVVAAFRAPVAETIQSEYVTCTSVKGNIGHLEACAAAGGLQAIFSM